MKLTVTDIMLIVDTLNGSLQIKDASSYIFHYHENYREDLSLKLQKFLSSVNVEVEIKDNIGG